MSLEEGTEVVVRVAQPYDSIAVAAIAWWDKPLEEVQEFNREAQGLRLGQGRVGERQLPVSIAAQHHAGPVGVDRMCYRSFWTLLDVTNYSLAYLTVQHDLSHLHIITLYYFSHPICIQFPFMSTVVTTRWIIHRRGT